MTVDDPRAYTGSHRDNVRIHAMRRLFERAGIAITAAEYERLCDDVRARLGEPDGVFTTGGRATYAVSVRGRTVYAGWSAEVGSIATFIVGGRRA